MMFKCCPGCLYSGAIKFRIELKGETFDSYRGQYLDALNKEAAALDLVGHTD